MAAEGQKRRYRIPFADDFDAKSKNKTTVTKSLKDAAPQGGSSTSSSLEHVPESINFPKEEERVLEFWKRVDAFGTALKQSQGRPRFSFYDGPPFATGLPHYGHILAGTIKDVVTRFAHQSGFHVERRFGWDCHGLPVEYEVRFLKSKIGFCRAILPVLCFINSYELICRLTRRLG